VIGLAVALAGPAWAGDTTAEVVVHPLPGSATGPRWIPWASAALLSGGVVYAGTSFWLMSTCTNVMVCGLPIVGLSGLAVLHISVGTAGMIAGPLWVQRYEQLPNRRWAGLAAASAGAMGGVAIGASVVLARDPDSFVDSNTLLASGLGLMGASLVLGLTQAGSNGWSRRSVQVQPTAGGHPGLTLTVRG
jgi:hypothetical protein